MSSPFHSRAFALIGLMVPLCVVGCASGSRNVTIAVWEKNIEQYVTEQGKGDPTVLRDVTLPDSRRGYSVIGSDRPDVSSDANGVLLGHRQIGGRSWFIYLVGLVKRQSVEEIRLAALTVDGGKFEWKSGSGDTEALQKYRDYNTRSWRQRFPQRGTAPPEYLGFPRLDDQFQMTISDGQVVVAHPASGAQWELSIPASTKSRLAAE